MSLMRLQDSPSTSLRWWKLSNWRDWTLKEFLETLETWTFNNPIQGGRKQKVFFNREGRMHTPRGCVYCTRTDHRAVNCTKVTDVSQRKLIPASKRLCFYCTGPHRTTLCKSQHLVTLAKENITRLSAKNHKCNRRHANQAWPKSTLQNRLSYIQFL